MPKKIRYFFIFNFLFMPLFFGALLSHAEVIDKILVIVNDEIITRGEIDRILVPIYQQYRTRFKDEELIAKLEKARTSVLEKLITDKLLLTEARKREIEVDQGEVDKRIEEVKKRFSSEEEFKEVLDQENIVLSEFEKTFKDRIMIDKVIDIEIRRSVSISPSEVVDFYDNHREEFVEPRKVKTRSILIRIGPSRPRPEALGMIRRILGRLEIGSDFSLLAKEYSDGPYGERGGDMGWVQEGDMMKEINEVIFDLDKNEISDILETDMGFHIFRVDEKMPSKTQEFHEVKNLVEQILYNKKVEEKLGAWIEQLKENAYIAFK